jgi:hypothetical protein
MIGSPYSKFGTLFLTESTIVVFKKIDSNRILFRYYEDEPLMNTQLRQCKQIYIDRLENDDLPTETVKEM